MHDLLFSRGIQAGDGPIKQAILRHKTRLSAELIKFKIKKGVKDVKELAQTGDVRAGMSPSSSFAPLTIPIDPLDRIPRYVRVNSLVWIMPQAIEQFATRGYEEIDDPLTTL